MISPAELAGRGKKTDKKTLHLVRKQTACSCDHFPVSIPLAKRIKWKSTSLFTFVKAASIKSE